MGKTVGIILSGGESRRFGKPKAFATYEGTPFWEQSYLALKDTTDAQLIVSHETLAEEFSNHTSLPIILDDPSVRGKGPMAGIYSGMKETEADWYVVLSCDIPAIQKEVIFKLLSYRQSSVDAIIPVINERFQPLVGIYHSSTLPVMKELLEHNNFRVISLLEQVNTLYLSETELRVEPLLFQNINDQDAYQQLINKRNTD
ncbi:molybdopterin-guanine dinucleotide biosynthesis protein A [Bacillus mesophilus]|uniref:Probable molybdenum cofactor guanylyltransferase n=1 Tax=Bacillus mesophilus TaxID=1808955 RepID=A0A6M0QCB1_9BACI|nr:molybdenum cofactor guanylyltransferase [Bacillus mesophilus]MBM7663225.1 molybdopterin-guanine dinucleotide biosynthesis protein A [Bacillus mesophilus]NEY73936.1 molybdenum cofactor guanylyltransferase [Bacillus mesophilus]